MAHVWPSFRDRLARPGIQSRELTALDSRFELRSPENDGESRKARVNAESRLAISPPAGEMSDRTEGGGEAAPMEFAALPPSVACSDISPARVEIENSRFRFPIKDLFGVAGRKRE